MIFFRRNKFLVFVIVVGVCLVYLYRFTPGQGADRRQRNQRRYSIELRSVQDGKAYHSWKRNTQSDHDPKEEQEPDGDSRTREPFVNETTEEDEANEDGGSRTREPSVYETTEDDDPNEKQETDSDTTKTREPSVYETTEEDEETSREDSESATTKKSGQVRDEWEEEDTEELQNTLHWVNRMGRGKSSKVYDQSDVRNSDSNEQHTGSGTKDSTGHAHHVRKQPITDAQMRKGNDVTASTVERKTREVRSTTSVRTHRLGDHLSADEIMTPNPPTKRTGTTISTPTTTTTSTTTTATTTEPEYSQRTSSSHTRREKSDMNTETTRFGTRTQSALISMETRKLNKNGIKKTLAFVTSTRPTSHVTLSTTGTPTEITTSGKSKHISVTSFTLDGMNSTTSYAVSFYTPTPSQSSEYSCKLPKLDPWDPSIRHLVTEVGVDPGCRSRYPQPKFKVLGNRLVAKARDGPFENVSLQTIHRLGEDTTSMETAELTLYLTEENTYKSNRITGSDFLMLSYTLKGEDEESHYFARVVPDRNFVAKSREMRQEGTSKGLPLNVLLLGFDSTSHANFLRKMPHTSNFLRTKLKTYIMDGYSIVGDATTPALTALLTGKFATELPEGRRGYTASSSLDDWPWISKEFEARGYATLYAEDDPSMSSFNLRLNGFNRPPYHHYMRPFWLALEEAGLRDEVGLCSNGVSMVNHTMDYIMSFFQAYNDTPKFAMGFASYIAHAHPNHLSYGDYDVLSMLKRFTQAGCHNDTMIVLFGDHGSRNDDVRNTMQGKLEERLPWLSISVPDWLETKFPEVKAALSHNQHVVSSPFDLHATLRHIMTYPDVPDKEKSQSLFTKLPTTRECRNAAIDDHWCPCLKFTPADITSPEVKKAARAAVRHINNRLNSTHILRMSCQQIQLTAIHSAMKYEPNSKVQRFYSTNQDTDQRVNFGSQTVDNLHYLVTMETHPMRALFEVTVSIDLEGHVTVNPNISRINKYGSQPKCIASKFPYMRKFCICKDFVV